MNPPATENAVARKSNRAARVVLHIIGGLFLAWVLVNSLSNIGTDWQFAGALPPGFSVIVSISYLVVTLFLGCALMLLVTRAYPESVAIRVAYDTSAWALGIVAFIYLVTSLLFLRGTLHSVKQLSEARSGKPVAVTRLHSALNAPTRAELSTGQVFRAASPSVVLIEVFDDKGHKRAIGSGFLAGGRGAIVTNYHVIRGAHSAVAHFSSGGSASVLGVVGYDKNHDVAVVTVPSESVPPLRLGSPEKLTVGDKVVAIGSPEGLQNTTSEGIVSAIRGGVIQMTTPISPGSSGGPVLDMYGDVVGIAVATVRGGENLNFAVPISWARSYLGRSPSKSLAEVAEENTAVENLLQGTLSIPAGRQQTWNITLNPNRMSYPEIEGQFQSSGGIDGVIRIDVACNQRLLFDSQRVTSGQVHVDLPSEGQCQFSIDNTASSVFARRVSGSIALRYVK